MQGLEVWNKELGGRSNNSYKGVRSRSQPGLETGTQEPGLGEEWRGDVYCEVQPLQFISLGW